MNEGPSKYRQLLAAIEEHSGLVLVSTFKANKAASPDYPTAQIADLVVAPTKSISTRGALEQLARNLFPEIPFQQYMAWTSQSGGDQKCFSAMLVYMESIGSLAQRVELVTTDPDFSPSRPPNRFIRQERPSIEEQVYTVNIAYQRRTALILHPSIEQAKDWEGKAPKTTAPPRRYLGEWFLG